MTETKGFELSNKKSMNIKKYKKVSYYTPEDILQKEAQNIILSNLLLTWAGCYIKAAGHVVNRRLLQDYVLIYCVDGKGWLELEEKRYHIQNGDLFVCPPGIRHSYGADKDEPWTKYWIHFRGNQADAYASLIGVKIDSPVVHISENMKLIYMFQEILNVLKTGYTNSNLILATAYLNSICSYLYNLEINNGPITTKGINVKQVVDYMLDHLNSNLDLEQLSQYVNLSKYHFTKLFKEKTGYSPIDFYIRLKMQKDCELLELSNNKIVSISASLGFNSPYYFSITFKRIVGQSPQNYRRMHLK